MVFVLFVVYCFNIFLDPFCDRQTDRQTEPRRRQAPKPLGNNGFFLFVTDVKN